MSRSGQHGRRRGGFSLLEVICALIILMLGCTIVSSVLTNAGRLVEIRAEASVEFGIAVELLDCIEAGAVPAGSVESLGDGDGATGVLERPEGRFRYSISRGAAEIVDGMEMLVAQVARERGGDSSRVGAVVQRLVPPVAGEEAADER